MNFLEMPEVNGDALVSSDSNYVRFADGTQIAYGNAIVTPVANTPTAAEVTFPIPFSETPRITVTPRSSVVGSTLIECGTTGQTAEKFNIVIYRTNSTTSACDYIAIGKWK